MASRFENCVNGMVDGNEISRDHARQVLRDFQNAKARGLNDVEAAAEASAADLLRAEAGKAKTAQQIIKETAALENAATHKSGARQGALATFVIGRGGESAEGAARAMEGILEAKFTQGILFLEPKGLGLKPDTVSARSFVREHYQAGSTGDALSGAAAKAWKETDDYGVKVRQAEGSNIKPLEGGYLPQPSNPVKIKRMGREAYIAARMRDWETGHTELPDFETGFPITDRARAQEIIEESWESISTDGLNKMEIGKGGGYKLANAHSERRVFHYTSAEAWMDAAERYGYGTGSLFDGLMTHIKEVSREYGLLRILGPNPDQTARKLIDQAVKDGKRMHGGLVGTRAHLEAVYDQITGRAASPENEGLARAGRTLAAGLRSAQLGSAMLSALGDAATTLKTADFNGLSKTKVLKRYLETATSQGREQAMRIGLGAEISSAVGRMSFRDGLEFGTAALASRFSDATMKLSLLQPHTRMARQAIGWELLADLAHQANRDFDQLAGRTLRAFERAGITKADWNLMKAAGVRSESGVPMMSPEALAKSAEGEGINTAVRLMALVQREMDMAAPVGGAFERALLQHNLRPGGLVFEFLARPFATYKMYPVSIITHHGFRMASTWAEEGAVAGMLYASLALTMTAVGAVAMQAKNVSQGKDPQSMQGWKFWAQAFAQGGGAGIFGDFLWSGVNRADQGWLQTLMGPQWGLVNDIVKLTGGNFKALGDDKDTHAGREAANMLRRYTPGTSLWYTRLALDRMLWDSVQKELDPDYSQAFRRIEQRARKEFSTEFWWAPGRSEPSRAPNFDAALATR